MTIGSDAENPAQAEQMVKDNYHACEYILDADRFKGVDFRTKQIQKNRDYER